MNFSKAVKLMADRKPVIRKAMLSELPGNESIDFIACDDRGVYFASCGLRRRASEDSNYRDETHAPKQEWGYVTIDNPLYLEDFQATDWQLVEMPEDLKRMHGLT